MRRKNNWFDYLNIALMALLSLSILIPFYLMIAQSLMTKKEFMQSGYTFFPRTVNLAAYEYLLRTNPFLLRGFQITVFMAVVGTALCLFFTSTYAYALSKKRMPYRKFFTFAAFFTMLFSGGLVPGYMLIVGLKLLNSVWAMILPAMVSPWNMFIMRNFFADLPAELEESAFLDGASEWTIWARIVLPLSMPAIATIGLFYAVGFWNSWVPASIYISDSHKWPLQMILRQLINTGAGSTMPGADSTAEDHLKQLMTSEGVQAAAILIASLPIMMVYPFVQKYFVKGIMIGSIKG